MRKLLLYPELLTKHKYSTIFLLAIVNGLIISALVYLYFISLDRVGNRWYQIVTVSGTSMTPTFNDGDKIIIVRPPQIEDINPGMIVSYNNPFGQNVCHRVMEVTEESCLITKGDTNPDVDRYLDENGQEIPICQINGRYLSKFYDVHFFFSLAWHHFLITL
ncbi:MAG: signal peptidase I [Candidatus Marinimicrobia bacterium]|nr:signal peptidase I [Candidatus Neomarinimicrobiota bacterium]